MGKQFIKPIALSLALVISLAQAVPVYCCGPWFPVDIFSYSHHPDLPLRKFAQGELGILQPSLAKSYLVVAYRYLTNRPLDVSEQNAVLSLWHKRLNSTLGEEGTAAWLLIHNTVPGINKLNSGDVNTYSRQPGNYQSYENCSQSALQTAATTLKERIARYGLASKEVKLWVENQDRVFSNCGGESTGAGAVTLPENPGPNADKLCQADFAYQTGAAYFYAGCMDLAREQFEKIAADHDSPWHNLAAYLQARTAVRGISLNELNQDDSHKIDKASIAKAEELIQKLLKDKSLSEYHDDLQDLLNTLRYRSQPFEEQQRLAKAVLSPHSGKTLGNDLDNYTTILDVICSASTPQSSNSDSAKTDDAAQAAAIESQQKVPDECIDDLTDWLFTFQPNSNRASADTINNWKSTKSIPWLIASLATIKSNDPMTDDLIKAAQAVPVQSPGYLSAQYYSIQLLIGQGKKSEAKSQLDQLLATTSLTIPPSSRNLLFVKRQQLASNLAESIRYGLKPLVASVADPNYPNLPDDFDKVEKTNNFQHAFTATFDPSMAGVMNEQFPLAVWKDLSHNTLLPSKIHNEVVAVTWMRANLLGDNESALKLTPMMQASYPSIRNLLSSFLAAQTPLERKFVASYIMLKAPGLSPYLRGGTGRYSSNIKERDGFGDNFWVPLSADVKPPQGGYFSPGSAGEDPAIVSPDLPALLTDAQKSATVKERTTMFTTASPPRFITETVIAWSKVKPNDTRLPEALFRAIKMPRWGCRVARSTEYSKAAYTLLHSKYPSTSWAANAEYYY